jgi:integrase
MGEFEKRYRNKLELLRNDRSICEENRNFFLEFFEKQEYKLKRKNGLRNLDESCYNTLYCYTGKFYNINRWFKNKPLKDITERDFKEFYDDFEDGRILTIKGTPFKDKNAYYNKIFRSKPFEMLGKIQMVRKAMEFHSGAAKPEVRFITEEEVRKIIAVVQKPIYRLLIWLAFDIGENISALLQLKKSDICRQIDKDTNIPEYRINLRNETLKRTRKARSEITNYKETVELLDILLKNLEEDEQLFNIGYGGAKKILLRAVKITESKCMPNNQRVTWKDLRSSMACDLLNKGWTCDEVNARLGHKPSSSEIDKYVNFLAIDRHKPKKKIHDHNMSKIQDELQRAKEREKLQSMRLEKLQNQMQQYELRNEEMGSLLNRDGIRAELKKELMKDVLEEIKNMKLSV